MVAPEDSAVRAGDTAPSHSLDDRGLAPSRRSARAHLARVTVKAITRVGRIEEVVIASVRYPGYRHHGPEGAGSGA